MRRMMQCLLRVPLVLLPSCHQNPAGPGDGGAFLTHPTDVGCTWTYEGLGRMYHIRVFNTTAVLTPDTMESTETVSITRELRLPVSATDLLDSIPVLEFRDDYATSRPIPSGGPGIPICRSRTARSCSTVIVTATDRPFRPLRATGRRLS